MAQSNSTVSMWTCVIQALNAIMLEAHDKLGMNQCTHDVMEIEAIGANLDSFINVPGSIELLQDPNIWVDDTQEHQ